MTTTRNDQIRQWLTFTGALAQIVVAWTVGAGTGEVANQNRSAIVPAGYAFAIWGLIFLFALAYGVLQLLPARRAHPLDRSIGWWVGIAFWADAIWELVFPNRFFLFAQLLIIFVFFCLFEAHVRLRRVTRKTTLERVDQLVTAPMLGMFFGWITAAMFAGFATTAVSYGANGSDANATSWGSVLLVAAGFLAAAVSRWLKTGPIGAWLAYLAAVVWAFVAIVVEHRNTTPETAVLAGVLALILVILAIWDRFPRSPKPSSTPTTRSAETPATRSADV